MSSRLAATARIISALQAAPPERRPRALLSASAVGFYGALVWSIGEQGWWRLVIVGRLLALAPSPCLFRGFAATQLALLLMHNLLLPVSTESSEVVGAHIVSPSPCAQRLRPDTRGLHSL